MNALAVASRLGTMVVAPLLGFSSATADTLVTSPGVGQAATQAPAVVRTLTVRYSDLNLSTEQGSRALYARILAAAYKVCPFDDLRDLQDVAAARACRAQAVAQAVRDVNSPRLTSVAQQLWRTSSSIPLLP